MSPVSAYAFSEFAQHLPRYVDKLHDWLMLGPVIIAREIMMARISKNVTVASSAAVAESAAPAKKAAAKKAPTKPKAKLNSAPAPKADEVVKSKPKAAAQEPPAAKADAAPSIATLQRTITEGLRDVADILPPDIAAKAGLIQRSPVEKAARIVDQAEARRAQTAALHHTVRETLLDIADMFPRDIAAKVGLTQRTPEASAGGAVKAGVGLEAIFKSLLR